QFDVETGAAAVVGDKFGTPEERFREEFADAGRRFSLGGIMRFEEFSLLQYSLIMYKHNSFIRAAWISVKAALITCFESSSDVKPTVIRGRRCHSGKLGSAERQEFESHSRANEDQQSCPDQRCCEFPR